MKLKQSKNKNFILYPEIDLKINLNDFPYKLPDSGLFLAKVISKEKLKNKKTLDLGTGYAGLLAYTMDYFGAKVTATDIDKNAIQKAKTLKKCKIKFKESNIFDKITNTKFDVIVSNPPQMPNLLNKKSAHDFGGKDGLLFFKKILKNAPLKKSGKIYFLIFDFLFKDFINLSDKYEFDTEILAKSKRYVRIGGETWKIKKELEKKFNTKFFNKNNKYFHYSYVIQCCPKNWNSSKEKK
jgi:methylase of polypeptide subunit release factors